MARKKNISGGGSQTNENGLSFEEVVDIANLLMDEGFIRNEKTGQLTYNGKSLAWLLYHREFYKWLELKGVNYKDFCSKRYEADMYFINDISAEVNVFEIKSQQQSGSTDEKLQSCIFKKMMFETLVGRLGYKVNYHYVLNDWFKKACYEDILRWIPLVGCSYSYNSIPRAMLKLSLLTK